MRHITVHGKYSGIGYSLSHVSIEDGGGFTDETRNTVLNVLRLSGCRSVDNAMIWDVDNWDEKNLN